MITKNQTDKSLKHVLPVLKSIIKSIEDEEDNPAYLLIGLVLSPKTKTVGLINPPVENVTEAHPFTSIIGTLDYLKELYLKDMIDFHNKKRSPFKDE